MTLLRSDALVSEYASERRAQHPAKRRQDRASRLRPTRGRIAPSKMLPSEEARAICDVTLDGLRAGGGFHDEPPREGGVPAGGPRALSPGDPGDQGADPR